MSNRIKEKPIIFSTPMVKAILDGRKTITRRVIKPQPPEDIFELCGPEWYEPTIVDKDGEEIPGNPVYGVYDNWGEWGVKCPYKPGDVLWVRETWGVSIAMAGNVIYKADYTNKKAPLAEGEKWRASIHMPKTATRIWLKVTNVRVERLQEITEEDVAAEGVKQLENGMWESDFQFGWFYNPIIAFKRLWNSLNAKKGYGWNVNPWVFVIEFRRLSNEEMSYLQAKEARKTS